MHKKCCYGYMIRVLRDIVVLVFIVMMVESDETQSCFRCKGRTMVSREDEDVKLGGSGDEE